jgi:hypothetical protein
MQLQVKTGEFYCNAASILSCVLLARRFLSEKPGEWRRWELLRGVAIQS